MGRRRRRKPKYPSNKDISEAIVRALSHPLVDPQNFYENVLAELRSKGLYPGLVTPKRVWRIYEEMIKRKILYDIFNVVKLDSQEPED